MNEERAPESSPRRSEGAGGGRRRAAREPLDPGDLATALRRSVAEVGASGPPRAGLARIRRKARARQRRRTVAAGGAGVLVMVMAVSVVTGNSFDIVPVLTSVVGLGGGDAPSSEATVSPDGLGQVRTVRPTAGRKGPAIGPGDVTATPSALAGAGVAPCSAADLVTVDSVDTVIGGVSYGHVEAVAQRACAVAGPPVLQVANATADAASSVVLLRHTASDGSQLPQVPTWGAVLVLKAGQGYDFQFAWAPDACPPPSSSGTTGATTAAVGPSGTSGDTSGASSGAGSATSGRYQLSYLVTATSLTSPVTLEAACGATVYVTDVYTRGAFPLPKPTATPTPQPATTSAAPDSPTTPSTPSSSAPPAPTASDVPTNGSGDSPGAPAASPVTSGQANGGSTDSAGQ